MSLDFLSIAEKCNIDNPLCYKQVVFDIKKIGYVINSYDAWLDNKIINNKQHALTWHVDDVKSAHVSPKVNDEFAIWCEGKYGSDVLVYVTLTRRNFHDYLGITSDWSKSKVVFIDMTECVDQMKEDLPEKLEKNREEC